MAAEYLPSVGAGLLKEQYYEKELKKQRKLPYRLLKLQQIVSTCGKVRGQTHRLSDSWNKVTKENRREASKWVDSNRILWGRAYISDDYVTIKKNMIL